MSFYVSTAIYFLLHCDEWDRFVAPPRHKFVTGAILLQLGSSVSFTPWEPSPVRTHSGVHFIIIIKNLRVNLEMKEQRKTYFPI